MGCAPGYVVPISSLSAFVREASQRSREWRAGRSLMKVTSGWICLASRPGATRSRRHSGRATRRASPPPRAPFSGRAQSKQRPLPPGAGERQHSAQDLSLAENGDDPGGNPVPLRKAAGGGALEHPHRLSTAHEVARQEGVSDGRSHRRADADRQQARDRARGEWKRANGGARSSQSSRRRPLLSACFTPRGAGRHMHRRTFREIGRRVKLSPGRVRRGRANVRATPVGLFCP